MMMRMMLLFMTTSVRYDSNTMDQNFDTRSVARLVENPNVTRILRCTPSDRFMTNDTKLGYCGTDIPVGDVQDLRRVFMRMCFEVNSCVSLRREKERLSREIVTALQESFTTLDQKIRKISETCEKSIKEVLR